LRSEGDAVGYDGGGKGEEGAGDDDGGGGEEEASRQARDSRGKKMRGDVMLVRGVMTQRPRDRLNMLGEAAGDDGRSRGIRFRTRPKGTREIKRNRWLMQDVVGVAYR
jgi:hypothetical protein